MHKYAFKKFTKIMQIAALFGCGKSKRGQLITHALVGVLWTSFEAELRVNHHQISLIIFILIFSIIFSAESDRFIEVTLTPEVDWGRSSKSLSELWALTRALFNFCSCRDTFSQGRRLNSEADLGKKSESDEVFVQSERHYLSFHSLTSRTFWKVYQSSETEDTMKDKSCKSP